MDIEFCPTRLEDWDLQCWGVPGHEGSHRGGNFATRRVGAWGKGVPTHVKRMKPRAGD